MKNCPSQLGLFLTGSRVIVASSTCIVKDKYIASFVTWKIQFDFQLPESQKHFSFLKV